MTKVNGKEYLENMACSKGVDTGIDRIVVHAGKFHSDDVFSVAMVLLCHPDAEIIRINQVTEEMKLDDRTIVADIGEGKYDHHQPDAECRENGDKYAACGLLYRELRSILFGKNAVAADNFERNYILPIERDDNGIALNPLSEAISAFNPNWDSDNDYDEAFAYAVRFAQGIILREIRKAEAEEKADREVSTALSESDGRVVVLHRFIPWKNILIPSTALFVIYPSARGGFNLQVIPRELGIKTAKIDLPVEWLTNKPEGCEFVHPGLFLACFRERETALNYAKILVRKAR